jgi:hypothetical protein
MGHYVKKGKALGDMSRLSASEREEAVAREILRANGYKMERVGLEWLVWCGRRRTEGIVRATLGEALAFEEQVGNLS